MTFDSFAWNDSALCWIFFANAVCCYLYRRSIEERIQFSPGIAITFLMLSGASLLLLFLHFTSETWYGPVTPTVTFFIFWYYDLFQTVQRFFPRRCHVCSSFMTVSPYIAQLSALYGEGRLCERDVWFCGACKQLPQRVSEDSGRSFCKRCNAVTRHEHTLAIIMPPKVDVIGTTSHRSVCGRCGTVHRRRLLVRPLLHGTTDDIYKKERELVIRMNRLTVSDE